jgi:hypothetical protein
MDYHDHCEIGRHVLQNAARIWLLPAPETRQIGGHVVHPCFSIRDGMMKLFQRQTEC